jgi:ADP-ribose pyrophosphatase YjhB (NUDIX family)
MKFCSNCGAEVSLRVPAGDNRPRYVCDVCHTIHYQNPKIVTGCIPQWQDRVLLCKRSIEPRYGLWTLPAGFMENGETTHQGAARETLEEARAKVSIEGLFSLFNLPHINQVYMIFRGRLLDLEFGAGDETLEAALFRESEIPWEEIAFPVIQQTLELYFQDRKSGAFRVHSGDMVRISERPRRYRTRLFSQS